jgi:hypothetical protein
MNISQELDLGLAWSRHKKDLSDMAFCDHPFQSEIIDSNLGDWIWRLEEGLADYSPSRCEVMNVPKKDFHLRPGAVLTPVDGTVYQALLLKEVDKIRRALLWGAQKERFSYILREDQTGPEWFVNEYRGWDNFREKSLSFVDSGYDWVVFADISAYFENISIGRLMSDLNAMRLSNETRDALSCCLNRWAEPKARGIPQGSRCSFILGEVYLNSVDKRLKNRQMKFCRYVDDIRIFCQSKREAVAALHSLTILLREKELNLQTAKSFIKHADEAREQIDNVAPVIASVEEDLRQELRHILSHDVPYATPLYIEEGMAAIDREAIELPAVREAFDEYIVKKGAGFNKSLFHYCIRRLGASKDSHAVRFCISVVLERPEEFAHMLPYFSKMTDERLAIAERLIDVFSGDEVVLDRHYFLLLRWIFKEQLTSDKIIGVCRELGFRAAVDMYTKHYAWAILGRNGDLADLDAIEAEYGRAEGELSKATIICCIRSMVVDRRNAVYSRALDDGVLVRYAVKQSRHAKRTVKPRSR